MPKILNINNYNVIYIYNNKNITSIHAYLNKGIIHEKKQFCGIMHLIEHMIIDSWKKCKDSCSVYWSDKSAIINAQTSPTFTRFFILGLNNGNQKEMYEYFCNMITDPKFTQLCLNRCKQIILQELKNKMENNEWKIENEFYKMIDDNTDYKGICRTLDYELQILNLNKISLEDIKECYKKWYNTSNLFLSVVTNENENVIKNYFSKYLKIKDIKKDILKYNNNKINIKLNNNYHSIKLKKQNALTTYCVGFIKNNPNDDIYIYKDLIKDILIGDVSSLLFLKLRDQLKLVYNIKMIYEFGNNYVIIMFKLSCDFKNKEKLIKEFFKCLNNFKNGLYKDNFLIRSKEKLKLISTNMNNNNTEFLNNFYCNQFLLTNNIKISPKYCEDKINSVSKNKITNISNEIFSNNMFISCENV